MATTGINFTPEELAKSAVKYRQTLLAMPIIALDRSIRHMTVRPGIRYKETVGELGGSIEIGPYDETREDKTGVNVAGRELETFFGSVIKKFSPNSVAQSVWGSQMTTSGDALKSAPITKLVLAFLMKKISQGLNKNLWVATRNQSGTTTKDLFNGFDTITGTEISGTNIATAKNNLYEFTEEVSLTNNAVEQLKTFYRSASDELRDVPTKLFIPQVIYDAYCDDYQATVGSVPYNREFKKTFLEGSNDLCELVPLSNKKDSKFIHLSTKENMLIGVDQMSDLEKITVEKHHPFLLDFVCAMFFGCQFESLSPERLLVGKLFQG